MKTNGTLLGDRGPAAGQLPERYLAAAAELGVPRAADVPPVAGPPAEAPPQPQHDRRNRRAERRAERESLPRQRGTSARSGLAAAGLLGALAAAAAAAVLLTFPQADKLVHLTHLQRTVLIPAGAVAAIIAVVLAGRLTRRLMSNVKTADRLTFLAASAASAVAATGMWRVFGDILHFDIVLKALLFPFIELAVITSAVRARDNMRAALRVYDETGVEPLRGLDVDGAAMWALTCLSAVLSSMAAQSPAEAIFRLSVPLVAAWLWERSLVSERRRTTGQRINWRMTPERILVRLGWAEPTGRAIGEVAAQRRVMSLALAAVRASALDSAQAGGWRHRRADRRVRVTLQMAIEHAGLAESDDRQRELFRQIALLGGYRELIQLAPQAPWARLMAGEDGGKPGSEDNAAPGGTTEDLSEIRTALQDLQALVAGTPDPSEFAQLRAAIEALRARADKDRGGDEGSGRDRDQDPDQDQDRDQDPDQDPEPDLSGVPSEITALAEALTEASRQSDGQRIHQLLAGRDDYEALVKWLGARQPRSAKRMMALVAMYATRQLASPAVACAWAAAHVPGTAGQIDKAEARRVRNIIQSVWTELNYAQLTEAEAQ